MVLVGEDAISSHLCVKKLDETRAPGLLSLFPSGHLWCYMFFNQNIPKEQQLMQIIVTLLIYIFDILLKSIVCVKVCFGKGKGFKILAKSLHDKV